MRGRIVSHGRVIVSALALLGACGDSSPKKPWSTFGASTSEEAIDGGAPGNVACLPSERNYDVPGNDCDDDGNGIVDDAAPACDADLAVTGGAEDLVRAMGLCQKATDTRWGLVSARFTNGYELEGQPAAEQHGILTKYGNVVRPRQGSSMAVLSTGWAREHDSDNGPSFKGQKIGMQPKNPEGMLIGAPPGYPKAVPGCPPVVRGLHDIVTLDMTIKVPANAKGLAFDFAFWSSEWPEFVCSSYNDEFVAFLTSQAFNGGTPGNMTFDHMINPVNVNTTFFDRCTPNTLTGCAGNGTTSVSACPAGDLELAGTGFWNIGLYCGRRFSTGGGSTGWLSSQAPVMPQETITLQMILWDAEDPNFDSVILMDHLRWLPGTTTPRTERPPK
jgi:hypothetical protein